MSTLAKISYGADTDSSHGQRLEALKEVSNLVRATVCVEPSFIVIDRRPLIGQCFLASLRGARPSFSFIGFTSVDAWQGTAAAASGSPVLLCLPGGSTPQAERNHIVQELAAIHACHPDVSVVVMSDCENPEQIIQVLKSGIKGYIPTTISLEIAIQALQLVRAGGLFMPVDCMMDILAKVGSMPDQIPDQHDFTPRQISVARALRKGTPNKIIAYELNMCESTVKIHVRNIMKKLKAKNRTEVAYLTNEYFSQQQ